jgi:NADP-dependent 3-hydroxy acid dehydrogenase YdfG
MSNYFITGTNSGIGKSFLELIKNSNKICSPLRAELDLNDTKNVLNYNTPVVDVAVHFAGHDLGGGVKFMEHNNNDIIKIINCNLISTVLLAKSLFEKNKECIQIFISSTNLDKFYSNNLAYNLSKNGIKTFIDLIRIEYPEYRIKEARVGLTKTLFNHNRHKNNHKPINDLYNNPHMTADYVAEQILKFIDSDKDFITINEKQI